MSTQQHLGHHVTQQAQREHAFETSFQSELHHIQQSLNPGAAQASRVIHSHSLETIGSRLNNTLLRPLALFMGGLFAMLTAAFMTLVATNDGFKANYTSVILAFIIGWLIGSIADSVLQKR